MSYFEMVQVPLTVLLTEQSLSTPPTM